ncbi:TPA: endoribonuclease, partial [Neisseria meningitidis]
MDKILIEQTLNNLDSLYQNNPADQVYYSKLAILELSGWLEETIDELLIHYSQSKLNSDNLKYFEEKIKNTWGANYSSNIRNLLIIVVGLINVETIENNLKQNGGYLDLLKNT